MFSLENQRELDGATLQDQEGRYYRKEGGKRIVYGYYTWLGGGYVCYTCGHLCECGEEGE